MSNTTTITTARILYRDLLRNAKTMKDYNFRSYAVRRIKLGYAESKSLEGQEAINAAIEDGKKQLEILKRQTVLSQLYPTARSVMES